MIDSIVILAFIVGAASGLVIPGAVAWVKDLKLRMPWWKWVLAGIWYVMLNFSVLLAFTMMGEGESAAGWRILMFMGLIVLILGVGLVRVLLAGRKKPA